MHLIPLQTAGNIIDIKDENSIVKSIYIKPKKRVPKPTPGQFFMVWVPRFEEIPLSVSGYYDGVLRFSVAKVGETTRRIHELKKGDLLGLKGPLGNGLKPDKKRYILVGGGYGVAPLVYLMNEIVSVGGKADIIIGARTKDLLLLVDEARRLGTAYLSTDDGSEGFKGTALDLAKEVLSNEEYDVGVVCGPKPLLVGFAEVCVKRKMECYVFAESYMKCGLGLCGSCVLGNSGLLVCRDGPVFNARLFLDAIKI